MNEQLYLYLCIKSDGPNCIVDQQNILPVAIELDWLVDVGKVLEAGVHRHHLPAQVIHSHREHADVGSKVCKW